MWTNYTPSQVKPTEWNPLTGNRTYIKLRPESLVNKQEVSTNYRPEDADVTVAKLRQIQNNFSLTRGETMK